MPTSQYSAMPTMASRAPMTFSSVGSGRNLMPTISMTPRSNEPISPLTGALLGGALGYLVTPESAASNAGSRAVGKLYDIAGGAIGDIGGALVNFLKPKPSTGGNVGPNVPTGSAGESYYEQDGKTYALMPNGQTRLVYDPATGSGSAGQIDDYMGGGTYTPDNYQPYTYQPTLSGGDLYGSYYNQPSTSTTDWTSNDYWGDYTGGWKDGGMATPLMADGGAVQEPSFYTYGTVVDPMQMLGSAQKTMAGGGMAQGGLHVPTVEGRHDYRAGSRVMGEGDGQSDDIPAMLADGEYVFDADTVAQLGNGSSKAGSDMLDKFREEIRAHKRSAPVNKIPPASKSPLQYLKQAQARSKKNG
jgi:hypothetical protein